MKKLSTRFVVTLTLSVLSTLLVTLPAGAAPPRVAYGSPEAVQPASGGKKQSYEVFVANLDGTGVIRVTDATPEEEGSPAVSPDGTRMVFIRGYADAVSDFELWIANLDGSGERQLTQHAQELSDSHAGWYVSTPDWSPDGRHVAYVLSRESDGWSGEVRIGDLAGGTFTGRSVRTVTEGRAVSWSPDGQRLAVASIDTTSPDPAQTVFRGQVKVLDRDGSNERVIHTSPDGWGISDVGWSPDGRRIAFNEWQPDAVSDTARVRMVAPTGGSPTTLPNARPEFFDWSDDGSTLIYDEFDHELRNWRIRTIRRDGTQARTVDVPRNSRAPAYVGNAPGSIPAQAGFDGDPVTTERLDAGSPTAAAIAASRRLWSDENGVVAEEATEPALPRATYAVLSRIDTFADSLAGAALTFRGPLLYTRTEQLPAETRAELGRVLGPRGLVYVLGGERAISSAVVATLQADGFTVRRLAGASRVETAIAVADEVRAQFPNYGRVLLARADGPGTAAWADSVTGGAFAADARIPLLLTPTDHLHPAVEAWMDRTSPSQTLLLGGTAALSVRVEQAVPTPVRVAGAARDETATEVARTLWKVDPAGTRRYTVVNGYATDGWAWGLATAGLADRADAPLLMVHPDTVPSATATAVTGCRQVDLLVAGDTASVREGRIVDLDARDTSC